MTMAKPFAILSGLVPGVFVFSILLSVIWPGEIELTAPLFCADPYRDPIVVSDTFHDSEGTSTNFTLHCVGDRGELTDEGFMFPWLTLVAAHTALIVLIAFSVTLVHRVTTDEQPPDSPRIGTEL
ncbi:hypothetical protein [Nocardia wallacei]|uniref:hypothetical protein n=1 Tax=Nocardia wallacei TaxID=480035 RepID=UPI0024586E99|nr:hypothetical protein [Nocardia wallacei]